ncbi:DUF1360 domain-containing protein [Thalassobacillus hwangdonensis]|uniref:DUF1360 domain-containing protein n=1 Tax=Thalassobacillus hwangdonensis TaxID=546108 RepID=A0ABW3KW34_9BACI
MGISWLELVMFSFASFRLTRLLVDDTIMDWFRSPFHHYVEAKDENGETEWLLEVKGTGLRAFIGELLSCHWCTGIWSTAILLAGWLFIPYFEWIILLLAISGTAAIIRVWVDR